MKVQFLVFFLFCVAPVFLYPTADLEEVDHNVAVNGDVSVTDKDVAQQAATAASPESSTKPKKAHAKRRPANKKKGIKKNQPTPITYVERSSFTDQLNQVMDETFLIYSKSLVNKTFNLKVRNVRPNLKTKPWAYLTKSSAAESTSDKETEFQGQEFEKLIDEDDADDEEEVVEELIEEEEDSDKEEVVEEMMEEVTEEHTEEDTEEDTEEEAEPTENTDQDQDQGETDEDEEDEEDDAEMLAFNQQFSAKVPASQSSTAGNRSFSLTPQPVSTASDKVKYRFKLLSKADMAKNVASVEVNNATGDEIKSNKVMYQQNPKKPNAKLFGLNRIKRVGDVQIGKRNQTVRVFDVPVQMGPLKFVMNKSAAMILKNSRVKSPLLTARLRITERDGEIVAVRIKPTKISQRKPVVSTVVAKEKEAPAKRKTARVVTHLSQEMARIWNSASFLGSTERRFKRLITARRQDFSESQL